MINSLRLLWLKFTADALRDSILTAADRRAKAIRDAEDLKVAAGKLTGHIQKMQTKRQFVLTRIASLEPMARKDLLAPHQ